MDLLPPRHTLSAFSGVSWWKYTSACFRGRSGGGNAGAGCLWASGAPSLVTESTNSLRAFTAALAFSGRAPLKGTKYAWPSDSGTTTTAEGSFLTPNLAATGCG